MPKEATFVEFNRHVEYLMRDLPNAQKILVQFAVQRLVRLKQDTYLAGVVMDLLDALQCRQPHDPPATLRIAATNWDPATREKIEREWNRVVR